MNSCKDPNHQQMSTIKIGRFEYSSRNFWLSISSIILLIFMGFWFVMSLYVFKPLIEKWMDYNYKNEKVQQLNE